MPITSAKINTPASLRSELIAIRSESLIDIAGIASLRPGANYAPYDVSADRQRFILAEPVAEGAEAPEPSIRVVQNWFAEFRDRQQD